MTATADPWPALVDVAIVGGGLAGCALATALARSRHRRHRPGATAVVAVACRRRVQLAGHGRGAAAAGRRRARDRPRGAPDPGDAPRDAGRGGRPPDVRDGERRPAGRGLRSLGARSCPGGAGDRRRRHRAAWRGGRGGRAGRRAAGPDHPGRRRAPARSVAASWSARTAPIRSSRGPRASPDPAGSPSASA